MLSHVRALDLSQYVARWLSAQAEGCEVENPEAANSTKPGMKAKVSLDVRCTASTTPRNFEELVRCWDATYCSPFDYPANKEGHASTNYPLWRQSSQNIMPSIPCIRSERYEPYLVLAAGRNTPMFEELFRSARL